MFKLKKLILMSAAVVFLGCFGSPVSARCVVPGDFDGNDVVDFSDMQIVRDHFGDVAVKQKWGTPVLMGDVNLDGKVDWEDILLVRILSMRDHLGNSCTEMLRPNNKNSLYRKIY